jgi:hypothetical protein
VPVRHAIDVKVPSGNQQDANGLLSVPGDQISLDDALPLLCTIFVTLNASGLIDGQSFDVKAERTEIFRYTTIVGAVATIEKWSQIQEP